MSIYLELSTESTTEEQRKNKNIGIDKGIEDSIYQNRRYKNRVSQRI